MSSLNFKFDIYLNDKEFGKFEYRLDGGETKEVSAFQSDDKVNFSVSESSSINNSPLVAKILGSTNIVVRATGYDGDTDSAKYELTNLKAVISQVGCSHP
jgi:hypothetical protein